MERTSPLPSPRALRERLPLPDAARDATTRARDALRAALRGRDPRLVAIVGPCSLHDADAAHAYAGRLLALAGELSDALLLVMRTYVEKPRTALGWKGLVSDPHLDGSCALADGLAAARALLVSIAARGVPCATEWVVPATAGYLADAVAWAAIGARTSASPPHRELASGLPLPVGFKNALDGDVQVALDGALVASHPQTVLETDEDGRVSVRHHAGNADAHVVLRGGHAGPNADAATIARTATALAARGLARGVLVDCSHGNAGKTVAGQTSACREVESLVRDGAPGILGVMLEGHLCEGRQELRPGVPPRPDVSITDPCLGWEETEALLRGLAEAQRSRGASARVMPAAASARAAG